MISAPASMRAISSRRRSRCQFGHPGRHPFSLLQCILGNEIVAVGARRDLRRVGHGKHLHTTAKFRQSHADGIGNGTTDAGVDFVEDKRGRRSAVGQHHFQRQ